LILLKAPVETQVLFSFLSKSKTEFYSLSKLFEIMITEAAKKDLLQKAISVAKKLEGKYS